MQGAHYCLAVPTTPHCHPLGSVALGSENGQGAHTSTPLLRFLSLRRSSGRGCKPRGEPTTPPAQGTAEVVFCVAQEKVGCDFPKPALRGGASTSTNLTIPSEEACALAAWGPGRGPCGCGDPPF